MDVRCFIPKRADKLSALLNMNLPNKLTVSRFALTVLFLWALFSPLRFNDTLALIFFCVASFTDYLDGSISRRRGLVTNFGKIADPIADKAMTGMAFIGLSIVGDIWWWVTIIVLLREWTVTLLRLSILKRVVVAAAYSGKVKTVLQAVALTALSLPLLLLHPPLHDVGVVLFYVFQVVLAVAVAITMWSGYEFFRDVWRQRQVLRTT